MSRLVYVDAVGGASGDMLLAALIDAGVSQDDVAAAWEAVLPDRFTLRTEQVLRAGLRARLLRIQGSDPMRASPSASRPIRDLVERVRDAPLVPKLRDAALAVLERLGEAEAAVHGADPEDVHLHELGDDDTLLDVVGVAAALDALGALEPGSLFVSSLPVAGGESVRASHGWLPLPSPVTLELLRGLPIRGEGGGETVTPTAAAILRALATPSVHPPAMTVAAVGYGAGTRDPEDRPNVLRVLVGTARAKGPAPRPERGLVLLEANLDDLSPELVADAVESLLSSGALDAWAVPVHMKKGRPGVTVAALCEADAESRLTRVFFEATSTLGVRSHRVHREELERLEIRVELPDGSGTVRAKVGLLDGRVVSVKPEHDDVSELARRTGRPVRRVHEEAAVAARMAAGLFPEAGAHR